MASSRLRESSMRFQSSLSLMNNASFEQGLACSRRYRPSQESAVVLRKRSRCQMSIATCSWHPSLHKMLLFVTWLLESSLYLLLISSSCAILSDISKISLEVRNLLSNDIHAERSGEDKRWSRSIQRP